MSEDTESTRARPVRRAADAGRSQGADGLRCSTAPSRKPAHARRQAARLGPCRAGQGAHRGQPARPPTPRRCSMRCRANCTAIPATSSARIQLLRREEKFAEAAQLMLSAPKDPNRLHNLDEWWIERRLLSRKMLDVGEHRTAYLIARDAALPVARHLQDRAGIHRGLDRAALPATIPRPPRSILRASASAASTRPRWRAPAIGRAARRKPRAAPRRRAPPIPRAAEQSTSYYGQLARAKLGLPQIELNGVPGARRAASNGWRSCARCSCSTSSTSARSRSRSSPTWARTAIPMRWSGSANWRRATATPAACC